MSKINIKIRNKLIALVILTMVLIALLIVRSNTVVAEWFVINISDRYVEVASVIFGVVPISMYELFLYVVIPLLIVAVVVMVVKLCKHYYKQSLSLLLTVCLCCIVFGSLYTAVAGMSYNREELDIPLYDATTQCQLQYDEVIKLSKAYINRLNYLSDNLSRSSSGAILYPSHPTMVDNINSSYDAINSNYLNNHYVNIKTIRSGWIMSQLGIAGVFFAPFGEGNVNGYMDTYSLPQTMAHEMAHAKGVMREGDANTLSRYVGMVSEYDYLEYSCLMSGLSSVLNLISIYPNSNDDYNKIIDSISDCVWVDFEYSNIFWGEYTLLGDIGNVINDLYLKIVGVKEGTNSYNPPPTVEGTGQSDEDGDEIVTIIDYSPTQNMIIELYLDGQWL